MYDFDGIHAVQPSLNMLTPRDNVEMMPRFVAGELSGPYMLARSLRYAVRRL